MSIVYRSVVNNGNNYDSNWPIEAEKRGLLNRRTGPDALVAWTNQENIDLFSSLKVLSPEETRARCVINHENFVKAMLIETRTMSEVCVLC